MDFRRPLRFALLLLPAPLLWGVCRLLGAWSWSPNALDFVTFALGSIVGVGGVTFAAWAARHSPWPIVAALALWALQAIYPVFPAVWFNCVLISIALFGSQVGRRIEHPSHLLAASLVASAADLYSVFSPAGPTAQIVRSPHALSLLAISAPVIGTPLAAPVIGLFDLVFAAIWLGVAQKNAWSIVSVTGAAWVGVLLAGLASAHLASAVPAIPAMSLALIALHPRVFAIQKKDVAAHVVAVVALVVSIVYVVRLKAR
jgi:hypothetical protein